MSGATRDLRTLGAAGALPAAEAPLKIGIIGVKSR
jgi:hypothetical protein